MTVLFSIALFFGALFFGALFFGAVAARVRRTNLEYLLTALGLAAFAVSAAVTATFPVHF